MSDMVERARWLAFEAHEGQSDRGGYAYINHVERVAKGVDGDAAKAAAWLHDVVEDTAWTLEGLRSKGFPEEVLAAVDALTKRAGETYTASMLRVMANPSPFASSCRTFAITWTSPDCRLSESATNLGRRSTPRREICS